MVNNNNNNNNNNNIHASSDCFMYIVGRVFSLYEVNHVIINGKY